MLWWHCGNAQYFFFYFSMQISIHQNYRMINLYVYPKKKLITSIQKILCTVNCFRNTLQEM